MIEWLQNLTPEEQLKLAAMLGWLSSVLLQIIKRWGWQPPEEAKVQKWTAAIVMAAIAGLGTYPQTTWQFVGAFIMALGASTLWHEGTDKTGLKRLWASIFPSAYTMDDAGGEG